MARIWFGLCLLAVSLTMHAQEVPPDALSNPFAGFETLFLSNGLKVWYKQMPDDPNVFIGVNVPAGSDDDPVGKEELAHFTEHMLFSDHLGRTEEEIKREIEDWGGSRNGLTYSDHTFYFVTLDKQHGLFALEWLYRILSPHEMLPEIVEKQREPVAIEVDARPRELLDWIRAYYLFPYWLRLPGFWEREFGLSTRRSRDYYPYRSLHAITPEDLRWFYDTYYVPSTMTLIVAGDFEREALLEALNTTFATLPGRPAPKRDISLHNPKRPWQSVYWRPRANVYYSYDMKLYRISTEDHDMLLFMQAMLNRRLNQRLRFGDRKAVYGVWVGISQRGPAASFYINGEIKKSEYHYARQVIDEELTALQTGTLPAEEFASDQQAVARKLRVNNTTAEDLGWWLTREFYNPALHRDFPDLVSFFEQVTPENVATFMQRHFIPEHQVRYISKPLPINQAVLACIPLALVALTLKVVRRTFIRPVDMTRIRYVTRFKIPAVYAISVLGILGILGAILARLAFYALSWGYSHLIQDIENFAAQGSVASLILVGSIFLGFGVLASIPYKLLVFEDHLRIKYRSYRSRIVAPDDVETIALRHFPDVWLSRNLFTCVPLTFGLLNPGIYLKLRTGHSYFFSVRNSAECQKAIHTLIVQ
jgi:predicted Zn-dependent peptidase